MLKLGTQAVLISHIHAVLKLTRLDLLHTFKLQLNYSRTVAVFLEWLFNVSLHSSNGTETNGRKPKTQNIKPKTELTTILQALS
jgi:hypothetical protein